jgi:hypothetical protein
MIEHINRVRDKSHIIISIETEKSFNEIQLSFTIKPLRRLGIEGTYLSIINYPTANVILNSVI